MDKILIYSKKFQYFRVKRVPVREHLTRVVKISCIYISDAAFYSLICINKPQP